MYDLAIVGSGFAGSLLSLIARRLGRSVVLIERGTHPRTVIGESSTPLSNLLLEELADRYDLPEIRSLSKWGTWQHSHPELACGLKRGFTFYHHGLTQPEDTVPRDRQLLVAASPHDAVADTHWYRADLDHYLVRQAQQAGADYRDRTRLRGFSDRGDHVLLTGTRHAPSSEAEPVSLQARFVIDATGPRGFLHQALVLGERPLPGMPRTQALYTHFTGVNPQERGYESGCGCGCPTLVAPVVGPDRVGTPPYPPQAAAVHHLFPGGWIWLLHFNNGVTSAGVCCTDAVAAGFGLSAPDEPSRAAAWQRLLDQIPALRKQFSDAKPIRPFTHVPRLSFRSAEVAGPRWALLPSAAGFVDPLLSTGFPLTLLGVSRLGDFLAATAPGQETSPEAATALARYAAQTDAELLVTARLLAALYANLGNFPAFAALTMLYFAAASYTETARRLGKPQLAPSFLLHDHSTLGPAMRALTDEAHALRTPEETAAFSEKVARAIEPVNVAGLADPHRRNWYPVEARDLFENAHKVRATREEIERLLDRCGFTSSAAAPNQEMNWGELLPRIGGPGG